MLHRQSLQFQLELPRQQCRIDGEQVKVVSSPSGQLWLEVFRRTDRYVLRFHNLADFEWCAITNLVRCWPIGGVAQVAIDHLFLNQVSPMITAHMGGMVIHASAVSIASGCVGFSGASGRGKSTLAASFSASGCQFLTDDGLQITITDDVCLAHPSHASIRLWGDSEAAVFGDRADVASAAKARIVAGDHLPHLANPRPLDHIFLLGDEPVRRVQISEVDRQSAFMELVKHSFILDAKDSHRISRHFEQVTELVSRIGFSRLDYPRDFKQLAVVRREVIDHMQQLGVIA